MEPTEILENLFDNKILKILKYFLKNEKQYYLREIARATRVSPASTYRILNKLVNAEILEINEIKTAKLYSLKESKNSEFLKSILEVDVLELFVEQISKINEVNEILLIGKREKNKVNLLILGQNIDTGNVKLIAGEIMEEHDFAIKYMCLSTEQYEQMSAMGLYPGSKKVLYRKV